MRLETDERHPATHGVPPKEFTGPGSLTVESTAPEPLASRARRHDYAVRVVSERRDGVLVTQYMTDLPAADRKRRRTLERGLRCELHLVRIVPVGLALDTTTAPTGLAELLAEGVGA